MIIREQRIFLESKTVFHFTPYGHLYLVLRWVEISDDGIVKNNSNTFDGTPQDRVTGPSDKVIRGTGSLAFGPLIIDDGLGNGSAFLSRSDDQYASGEKPDDRHSKDVTTWVTGTQAPSQDEVLTAWNKMAQAALKVQAAQYDYDLPDTVSNFTANSNALILTALNAVNADVRKIPNVEYSGKYVESYHLFRHPGATDGNDPTLLGQGSIREITASGKLESGIVLLGRDNVDDIMVGTRFADRFYGEQEASWTASNDLVSYERTPDGNSERLTDGLTIGLIAGPAADYPVGRPLEFTATSSNPAQNDIFYGIERVLLTTKADRIVQTEAVGSVISVTTIDGGGAPLEATSNAQLGDVIDFSAMQYGAAVAGPTLEQRLDGTRGAQLYDGYSSLIGPYAPTNVFVSNFEHVIGSGHADFLNLWALAPGGELTAAQRANLDAARSVIVSFASGDPAQIGAASDARMEQARAIPQNQQDVLIEAGGGSDTVRGTETGANRIYGGAGNDRLFAGGFTSALYGGAGSDYVEGGGFKSLLYGGDGTLGADGKPQPDGDADIFGLADHTFVMDAGTNDYATWGPYRLTGGVELPWMEKGWAYPSLFSSLIAGAPLPFALAFAALSPLLDPLIMAPVRYAIAGSGDDQQLIVQYAGGRGGQAVIDNYKLDLDTGEATANIVAFRQVIAKSSLADFLDYINLALKAAFGVCISGTDPLILDLDGDGLDLQRLGSGSVYFDLDKDGFAERTVWVKGDDGFLARDLARTLATVPLVASPSRRRAVRGWPRK